MKNTDIQEITMATSDKWKNTKAFVSVTFTNGLILNGVKVIEWERDGKKNLFVGMPSVPKVDPDSPARCSECNKPIKSAWKDCCFLKENENCEDKSTFQEIILTAYYEKVGKPASGGGSNGAAGGDGEGWF